MERACVYQQKTVVSELSQGIQMAKQLRVHLNSAEAREFLIQKILSSYENALFLLKSGDSSRLPQATTLPAASLPDSSIEKGGFETYFNHQGENVVTKKRKGLTTWEDQSNKRKQTYKYNHDDQSAAPPPPPSPEKYELKPTHHNQLSTPNSLRPDNLSVLSFPSSPFGSMGDYQQLHFPDYFDDDLLPVQSPSFISPNTSESNYFTEWGSSPSLDFSTDPTDVDLDFKFDDLLF